MSIQVLYLVLSLIVLLLLLTSPVDFNSAFMGCFGVDKVPVSLISAATEKPQGRRQKGYSTVWFPAPHKAGPCRVGIVRRAVAKGP
jgi:hypothetical protein